MKCYNCVRKDYCTYIYNFNHDLNVGCTDFQDRDYTTYVSDTLNTVNTTPNSTNSKALEVSKQLKDFVLEFVNNGLDRLFVQGSFDIIEDALKRNIELEEENKVLETIRDNFNLWIEPKYKATLQLLQCCSMPQSEYKKFIEYFGEPNE